MESAAAMAFTCLYFLMKNALPFGRTTLCSAQSIPGVFPISLMTPDLGAGVRLKLKEINVRNEEEKDEKCRVTPKVSNFDPDLSGPSDP